jgi:hypothetical protein
MNRPEKYMIKCKSQIKGRKYGKIPECNENIDISVFYDNDNVL